MWMLFELFFMVFNFYRLDLCYDVFVAFKDQLRSIIKYQVEKRTYSFSYGYHKHVLLSLINYISPPNYDYN